MVISQTWKAEVAQPNLKSAGKSALVTSAVSVVVVVVVSTTAAAVSTTAAAVSTATSAVVVTALVTAEVRSPNEEHGRILMALL